MGKAKSLAIRVLPGDAIDHIRQVHVFASRARDKAMRLFLPAKVVQRIDTRRVRRMWLKRSSTEQHDLTKIYWGDTENPNRHLLVELAKSVLHGASNPSILEFGSHVGINLHMLHSRLEVDPGQTEKVQWFAVEPNVEAFNFMLDKMPYVRGLNTDDIGFVEAQEYPCRPPTRITLSIVNGVFAHMDPFRTKVVIEKLSRISQVIILGEGLGRSREDSSTFS